MAEGKGLELNSLGGVLIKPAGCCGDGNLGVLSQVFAGARRVEIAAPNYRSFVQVLPVTDFVTLLL